MISKYACFVETQTMEENLKVITIHRRLIMPTICVDFLSFNIIGIGYDIEICMFCGDTNHGRAKSMRKQLSKQVKKRIRQAHSDE